MGADSDRRVLVAIYGRHTSGAGKVCLLDDIEFDIEEGSPYLDDFSIYEGTPAELLGQADELERLAHKAGAGDDIFLLRSAAAIRREARAHIEQEGATVAKIQTLGSIQCGCCDDCQERITLKWDAERGEILAFGHKDAGDILALQATQAEAVKWVVASYGRPTWELELVDA